MILPFSLKNFLVIKEQFSFNTMEFSPYLYCQGIRFNPTSHNGYPSLVMQYYGRYLDDEEFSTQTPKCSHPLGIGNTERVHTSQITGSSWEGTSYPYKSRLDGDSCWISGSTVSKEYIEVDLGHVYQVNGIVVQSCKGQIIYSFEFDIEYSLHRIHGWKMYTKPQDYKVSNCLER